ncbi:20616_t:CDS:1, partial [Funneliformis geosporum]
AKLYYPYLLILHEILVSFNELQVIHQQEAFFALLNEEKSKDKQAILEDFQFFF